MTLRYSPTERSLRELLTVSGIDKYRLQPELFDVVSLDNYAPGLRDGLDLVIEYDIKGGEALAEVYGTISDNLSTKYEDFLHGSCHLLAIELHKTYGLPLEGSLEYDFEIDGLALQHAWVRWNDDYVIDAAGLRSFKQLTNSFGDIKDVQVFKPNELHQLGGKPNADESKQVKLLARTLYVLAECASLQVLPNAHLAHP